MTNHSWTPSDVSRIRERALKKMLELSIQDKDEPPRRAPMRVFTGWHEAAAVLGLFSPALLRPVEPARGDLDQLLVDCVPESGQGVGWTLLPDVRAEVLDQLQKSDRMPEALAANRHAEDRVLQMVDACWSNTLPALDTLDLPSLSALIAAIDWVRAYRRNLPKRNEVESRLDFLRLLQPFERLAGTHFRGREQELAELRDYVGILETRGFASTIRRGVDRVFQAAKPPFVLYGPGGIGKSTLIARFLLDHAQVADARKFPFAYLDFDRPGIAADEPVTLLIEVVRQLGVQYPKARSSCEEIRSSWQRELVNVARRVRNAGADSVEVSALRTGLRTSVIETFETLLQTLGVETRPLLIVLDTFEEVQFRGVAYVNELWSTLTDLQKRIPRLRTVIVGRAPLTGFEATSRSLEALDKEAARGFLEAHGIRANMAQTIAHQIGGVPLTLRLAAAVFQKEGPTGGALQDIDVHRFRILRLKEEQIQGQLFGRILRHIHDPIVRKIAHPGLVLRRVTPELILTVLANPCGVKVSDLRHAGELFEKLSREVSLVSPAPEDGALLHRTDVRRVMLSLLQDNEPLKVQDIHERAIAYYEPRSDVISRAEEIYHRLTLQHPSEEIDRRWMNGVESYLASAIEELSGPERAWLSARLGMEVDPQARRAAAQEVWEREAEKRARDFIRIGNFEAALQVLHEREERSGKTDVDIVEAQVLDAMDKVDAASAVADRAIATYSNSGNTLALLRALIISGRLLRRRKSASAQAVFEEAAAIARSQHNALALLEIAIANGDAHESVCSLAAQVTDSELSRNVSTLRGALLAAGNEDNALLARGVRIIGLTGAASGHIARIQSALRRFDRRATERLSDELREVVHLPGDRMSQFESLSRLTRLLLQLLEANLADAPIREATAGALLGVSDTDSPMIESDVRVAAPSRLRYRKIRLKLAPEQRAALERALARSFGSRAGLGAVLQRKLAIEISALSFSENLSGTIVDVITAAERKGWLVPLIAAARHAHFTDVQLLHFCDSIGMSLDLYDRIGGRQSVSQPELGAFVDRNRSEIGELETQVCRIEIGGTGFGSGFLVTPSIIATAASVVARIEKQGAQTVRVRFDYGELAGVPYTDGIVYGLHEKEWLVRTLKVKVRDWNHDLVGLLRLSDEVGRTPLGPDPDEIAPIRGFVRQLNVDFRERDTLFWLWYGRHGAGRISGVRQVSYADDQTITIPAGTRAGVEGAPCVDSSGHVVGIHCGRHPNRRASTIAVRLGAIAKWIDPVNETGI